MRGHANGDAGERGRVMVQIYVTRRIPDVIRRQLEVAGVVSAREDHHPIPRNTLLAGVEKADALLCYDDDHIDRAVMASARRLRVISTASVGIDHIDMSAAGERGIVVCHAPGAAEHAAADMAMALLLACARHLIEADLFVKSRRWEDWNPEQLLGEELRDHTIGIIGLGNIGLQVAHRAVGFGMRILYYDARRHPEAEDILRIQYGSLDNVLREADFVSLHVPLTADTTCLIGKRELRLMKPTAYLINTSRGSVVKQTALVQALREGWIAGAGLDVYEEEPLPADDPLLNLPNVVLSPHIGAHTPRSILSTLSIAAEQIVDVLQGHQPAHPVAWHGEIKKAA